MLKLDPKIRNSFLMTSKLDQMKIDPNFSNVRYRQNHRNPAFELDEVSAGRRRPSPGISNSLFSSWLRTPETLGFCLLTKHRTARTSTSWGTLIKVTLINLQISLRLTSKLFVPVFFQFLSKHLNWSIFNFILNLGEFWGYCDAKTAYVRTEYLLY